MSGLRVVLADDDVLLREGLASLLQRPGMEVVGQAGDSTQLLTLVRENGTHTYRSGDVFEVASGTVHEERAGPQGVRYIAGRRHR